MVVVKWQRVGGIFGACGRILFVFYLVLDRIMRAGLSVSTKLRSVRRVNRPLSFREVLCYEPLTVPSTVPSPVSVPALHRWNTEDVSLRSFNVDTLSLTVVLLAPIDYHRLQFTPPRGNESPPACPPRTAPLSLTATLHQDASTTR
jgi:hypothetical protein